LRLKNNRKLKENKMPIHPKFIPFNFTKWVEDNQDKLQPPVNNQLLHHDSGMIVMVVGGPNTRVDFHDDPVEEWFYQIKGDMMLKVREDGVIYDVPIREGEVFMMPAHTIHAPQRPQEGSLGIVVESPRMAGMREGFEWFCFECGTRVHRIEVALVDPAMIVEALPQVYNNFHDDIQARTCPDCGTLHPGKGKPPADWVKL
jgi:3-hydroxyanthranilate 3,4-dioxygenase